MVGQHRPLNPLLASAVAAWLATSAATGCPAASADATGTASSSSSASSSSKTAGAHTAKAPKHKPSTKKASPTAATADKSTANHAAKTATPKLTPAATAAPQTTAQVTTKTKTTTATKVAAAVAVSPTAAASTTAASTPATTAVTTAVHTTTDTGIFGFLNHVVANLLDPFVKPAPANSGPLTPVVWAVFGWVRRNLFNQSPTVTYNPMTTTQTGQSVTGNIGATDPEGDKLTYKVTQKPQNGTVTIDQTTGTFTYTPNDINYDATQSDTFTVSVSDGKFNLLNMFGSRSAKAAIDLTVLSPTVQRVILTMPDGITNPVIPRFTPDGTAIDFAATPSAGGRQEIYQINVDGTGAQCLTCGVTTSITNNLSKPVPFSDGSGRVLMQSVTASGKYTYVVLESGVSGRALVPVITPPAAAGIYVIDPQREMRISPDGTKVLFSQIQMNTTTGFVGIVPVVGTLNRTAAGYEIDDARVVYPTGEDKQWTPDGKGVIILGGTYEQGNGDDIEVDLQTGKITRITANPDYDEDIDMSPNEQWIAVGSLRGTGASTAVTRIDRPSFLPAYFSAVVYGSYSKPINVSNQDWAIALKDELTGEVNGLPLFVDGDGYTSRSMPSWNSTGTAVTFWESSATGSRIVVANLKYTTSVGTVATDRTTPSPSWAPTLASYHLGAAPLPAVGSYAGVGGGTAVISEAVDPTDATKTVRTVRYTNYVNKDGLILNGTESTDTTATQVVVHYLADITITGTQTGYLKGDATLNSFQQAMTGYVTSSLDGDVQNLLDPATIAAAQQGV